MILLKISEKWSKVVREKSKRDSYLGKFEIVIDSSDFGIFTLASKEPWLRKWA